MKENEDRPWGEAGMEGKVLAEQREAGEGRDAIAQGRARAA